MYFYFKINKNFYVFCCCLCVLNKHRIKLKENNNNLQLLVIWKKIQKYFGYNFRGVRSYSSTGLVCISGHVAVLTQVVKESTWSEYLITAYYDLPLFVLGSHLISAPHLRIRHTSNYKNNQTGSGALLLLLFIIAMPSWPCT